MLKSAEGVNLLYYTKEWLKVVLTTYYGCGGVYDEDIGTRVSESLLYWFEVYKKDKKRNATKSIISKADSVKALLIRYQDSMKNELLVKDVDVKFCMEFEKYCYDNGYATNTISSNIVFIKTVCSHAKINGVKLSDTFDYVKIKREKVDSIYLNEEDISKLINLDDLPDDLDVARDWLLISCRTGQRVSDFMKFDKDMMKAGKNKRGELRSFIDFTQKKVDKIMSISLVSQASDILDKQDGEFPRSMVGQKYSYFIKLVCQLAKINEKVDGGLKGEDSKGIW